MVSFLLLFQVQRRFLVRLPDFFIRIVDKDGVHDVSIPSKNWERKSNNNKLQVAITFSPRGTRVKDEGNTERARTQRTCEEITEKSCTSLHCPSRFTRMQPTYPSLSCACNTFYNMVCEIIWTFSRNLSWNVHFRNTVAILFICTFLVHIVRINSKKPISSCLLFYLKVFFLWGDGYFWCKDEAWKLTSLQF